MWLFPSLQHEEIHSGIVVAALQTCTVGLVAKDDSFLYKDITQIFLNIMFHATIKFKGKLNSNLVIILSTKFIC